jgi:hypothetical protein
MNKIFHINCLRSKESHSSIMLMGNLTVNGITWYLEIWIRKYFFYYLPFVNVLVSSFKSTWIFVRLQTRLEKCCVCAEPVLDRILRANGKPYHPKCFTCVVCNKSLEGIQFTIDAANRIYCIEDFHKYVERSSFA